MKIFLGADHAGYELKEMLKKELASFGMEVFDKGASALDPADDYPDFIAPVAREVSHDPKGSRGVILGGTGEGEAMVANRFPNIRATVYYGGPKEIITLSRQHNNANVLSLGARFLSIDEAREAVKLWLNTSFSNDERHIRRIEEIEHIGK
jgi:ribose 5-phosphate isomerase B